MRVGIGYDVHKLVESRKLIIGGVCIPYEKGLLGHSDADVLLHAITDAILGAAGLRDIGYYFSDQDEENKDVNSRILLKKALKLIEKEGFKVSNIDSVIVAQEPKMSPHIENMVRNIAQDLQISTKQVSVKATTSEGLGFEGEKLGISSKAIVLLEKL